MQTTCNNVCVDSVLFTAEEASGDWASAAVHPEAHRLARLRAVASTLSTLLSAEWVGIYRVILHNGMYVSATFILPRPAQACTVSRRTTVCALQSLLLFIALNALNKRYTGR
jgi:hypothetical protein